MIGRLFSRGNGFVCIVRSYMTTAVFEVHLIQGHDVEELDEVALGRITEGLIEGMDPLEGALVIDDGRARAAIIDELASAVQGLCFEAVTALIERPAESYRYRYFNTDTMARISSSGSPVQGICLVLVGQGIPATQHDPEALLVALYQCGIRYLEWLERIGREGHVSAATVVARLRPLAAEAHAALASRGWA